MTRVLVCGGRKYADTDALWSFLDRCHAAAPISVIIHGDASGADKLAGKRAAAHKIEVRLYQAEWKTYGAAAGPIRNKYMLAAGRPDVVIAFAGGSGTADMVRRAERAGVPVVRVA